MGADEDGGSGERSFGGARLRVWQPDPGDDDVEAFTAEQLEELDAQDPPLKRFQRASKPSRNVRLEEALRARLKPAGFDLMFREDEVYLDGRQLGHGLRAQFLRHDDPRDLLADDDAFGAVVDRWLSSVLRSRARKLLRPRGQKAPYLLSAHPAPGWRVMRGNDQVGTLAATTFTNADGESVNGGFWAPGDHWRQASELLLPLHKRRPIVAEAAASTTHASESTAPAPVPVQSSSESTLPTELVDRLEVWPDSASGELTDLARVASDRLRTGRIRSDDFWIEVECGGGRYVDFSPVRRRRNGRLDLPFAVRTEDGELLGCVYLKSPNPVLAISVSKCDQERELLELWTLALQVAAARYCGQPSDPSVAGSEPLGFLPDGKTSERMRHRVAAHLTRLQEGHHASDDAVKAAEEVDIELPPGYTWTNGHARGSKGALEIDAALRYSWRPPPDALPAERDGLEWP